MHFGETLIHAPSWGALRVARRTSWGPHPASLPLPAGLAGRPVLRLQDLCAMSQGAGLVRTTCSSSAFGPAAGAGPRGAGPSEGLLDPIYPRTHGALLKVAQMVRQAQGAGAGVTRSGPVGKGSGEGTRQAARASLHGRAGAAPPKSR